MLAVNPTSFRRDKRCAACGMNIPAGRFCLKVTSDVDPGKSAVMCFGCFSHSTKPFMREYIDKMIAKNFPNESRTRKAQEAILDKVSKTNNKKG